MLKLYMNICGLLLLAVAVFFFIIPDLISAKDDFLVGLGFILILVSIPVFFTIGKKIWVHPEIQSIITDMKGKDNG